MKTIRWGILGLGKIAHYFVEDLLQVENAELYAVASRSMAKAESFAEKYKAHKAYGSYEDLYQDANVDVIYIATPHAFHYENTLEALKAKKAVLCEKPIALNATQAKQMIEIARSKKVFLMEAIWTNFMPHLEKVAEITTQQKYGALTTINAEFCFKPEYNPESRLFNPDLGGGALLDIGIYPVYLSLKLLGIPKHIKATQTKTESGVDLETKMQFTYSNGAVSNLFCSFKLDTPSEAVLEYENASIRLHSRFHETDKISITSEGKTDHIDYEHKHRGYNFEIEHVNECLSKGLTESPKLPLEFSLNLMTILDEIRLKAEANLRE
jgi:predicted dehydrogenase